MAARDRHVVEEDAVLWVAAKGDLGLVKLEGLANLGTLDDGERGVGRLLLGHEVRHRGVCRGHAKDLGGAGVLVGLFGLHVVLPSRFQSVSIIALPAGHAVHLHERAERNVGDRDDGACGRGRAEALRVHLVEGVQVSKVPEVDGGPCDV